MVTLESPRLVVLGDFNIHAEAPLLRIVQDFMFFTMIIGLSQMLSYPTHATGYIVHCTSNLVFYTGLDIDDLAMEELYAVSLPWTATKGSKICLFPEIMAENTLHNSCFDSSLVIPRQIVF